tara:strand:+ start:333 stop:692 length:360 start_codon:yes stop_codon:yes gene_type:complete
MRKIEREMIQAIIDRKSFNKANTSVSIGYAGTMLDHYKDAYMSIKLHGNEIAKYYYNKDNTPLYINHCGWKTVTTKSRLNALIKHVLGGTSGIYQHKFDWFLKKDKEVTEFPCNQWVAV